MITMPVMVISYGDFSITSKLFSYQLDDKHILPMFTDGALALSFIDLMNQVIDDQSEKLEMQACINMENCIKFLEAINICYRDVDTIMINPSINDIIDGTGDTQRNISGSTITIVDALEILRNQNSELDSNTL